MSSNHAPWPLLAVVLAMKLSPIATACPALLLRSKVKTWNPLVLLQNCLTGAPPTWMAT